MAKSNFDLDFENFTDEFAFNLTADSMVERYAGMAIYAGFSFMAIIANIVMIVLIYKKGRKISTFDLSIGSLAVADFITSIFFLTNTILLAVTFVDISYETPAMRTAFKILGNGSMYCIISSIFHILSITIERLFGITFPFIYRQKVTKFRVKILILFLWVASAGITVLDFVVWSNAVKGTVLAAVVFSIGGLLCVLYGIIAVKAYMRKKAQSSTSRKETRVIKNSLAVTLCFLFCTFPVALADLRFNAEFSEKYGYMFASFVAVKLFLDPLLYFFVSFWRARAADRRRIYRLGPLLMTDKAMVSEKSSIDRNGNSSKINVTETTNECLEMTNSSEKTIEIDTETKESDMDSSQNNGVINNGYCEEQLTSDAIENNNIHRFTELEAGIAKEASPAALEEFEAEHEKEASTSQEDTVKIDVFKMVESEIDGYFSEICSYLDESDDEEPKNGHTGN